MGVENHFFTGVNKRSLKASRAKTQKFSEKRPFVKSTSSQFIVKTELSIRLVQSRAYHSVHSSLVQ